MLLMLEENAKKKRCQTSKRFHVSMFLVRLVPLHDVCEFVNTFYDLDYLNRNFHVRPTVNSLKHFYSDLARSYCTRIGRELRGIVVSTVK